MERHGENMLSMIAEYLPQIREAVPVIISLIIIEGLLSVDNMLMIATLASGLPEKEKKLALRTGLAGAYLFRGVALFFVGFIMANAWIKFLGAFYLIHLMAGHFSTLVTTTDGNSGKQPSAPQTFWSTVIAIQLMDLSLSVDNVVTAVAMSSKIWVVCTGVCLGLLTLWLFASISLKLVEKYPILKHSAFLLIGYVGAMLLVEMGVEYLFHLSLHVDSEQKFIGVTVIMGVSFWYAQCSALRRFCAPIFRLAIIPMVLYTRFIGAVAGCVVWPFKAIYRSFSRSGV